MFGKVPRNPISNIIFFGLAAVSIFLVSLFSRWLAVALLAIFALLPHLIIARQEIDRIRAFEKRQHAKHAAKREKKAVRDDSRTVGAE